MTTYFDLVQDEEFRDFVEKRLSSGTNNTTYSFEKEKPKLYKYQPLSYYAVENIINGKLTATRIGEFNDLFDGAIHCYGSKEEIDEAAEAKWDELKSLMTSVNSSGDLIDHDYYVGLYRDHFKTDSRLKFRQLDYLGTFAICLSSKNDSTLMWSHYANSNTGMCVEYDFNSVQVKPLQRNMIFPVAYSSVPVFVKDLIEDEKSAICKFPIDTAVLCTALNKADVWKYENEWRLVLVLPYEKEMSRRIQIIVPKPSKIILGYHFLKNFFYHDSKNDKELIEAKNNIENSKRLLDYVKINQIPISITIPMVGGYKVTQKNTTVEEISSLIDYHFEDDEPENIRYYYVVHDEMMDMLNL